LSKHLLDINELVLQYTQVGVLLKHPSIGASHATMLFSSSIESPAHVSQKIIALNLSIKIC